NAGFSSLRDGHTNARFHRARSLVKTRDGTPLWVLARAPVSRTGVA
ncbi:MAG: hypothetical protein HC933_02230, partial [Pleurocapsa sp. SU_196_0]|nr:hypothetical protein [Pleurocapsa sp. SU_196_0]